MVLVYRQILLVFHILLAITWVGGIFFIGWGVYPAFRNKPFVQQRTLLQTLMQWSHKFLTAAGAGVIITGLLLGTVFGPVDQWGDILTTRYGATWAVALIIGVLTLLWGTAVGFKQSNRLFANTALWEQADTGRTKPLRKALIVVALLESVEAFGFAALVILMISF